MTKNMMDQVNASMPPNLCAPAAAFLAHESCPLNGEVLQIGMGSVARIAVVYSQGLSKPTITAEDIAENLDAVMDLRDLDGQDSTLRRPAIVTSEEAR
jgi:hypothetical protein